MVGAPLNIDNGSSQGSAFVFEPYTDPTPTVSAFPMNVMQGINTKGIAIVADDFTAPGSLSVEVASLPAVITLTVRLSITLPKSDSELPLVAPCRSVVTISG